jgi:integrase
LQFFVLKHIIKAGIKKIKGETMNWLVGRPNTIATKHSLWLNWIKPQLKPDGSNLDESVQIWEDNLEPNSIKAILYVAKAWVKHETGADLNVKPHISRVLRSKQEVPVQILSKEEIVALTQTCKEEDPELYLPIMLALHTGMRRGEVWGLIWDDVDVLNDQILISKSYTSCTKNGKSRVVPISYALEGVLMAQPGFISYNYTGPKRSKNIVPKIFDPNPRLRAICKKLGMRENITFHTLRHSFATLALESGRSPKLVSQTLGHSQLSTTLNLYWSSAGEKLNLEFLPKE